MKGIYCVKKPVMAGDPRLGVTSRITPARGRRKRRQFNERHSIDLAVLVDCQYVDPQTREIGYRFEAIVDLIDGSPALTSMNVVAGGGLDMVRLQREFRWASPLDVITRSVPVMLDRGLDPFSVDLPTEGSPESADLRVPAKAPLTDGFLEDIAREYLVHGRDGPSARRLGPFCDTFLPCFAVNPMLRVRFTG